MRKLIFALAFLSGALLPLSSSAAAAATDAHQIKYSVANQLVSVVSATTPYDSHPEAREAFLHWFKRGFNTILTGQPPLMIEWKNSPLGKAGQRGYDFGLAEAERYLEEKKAPAPSLHKATIPPI